MEERENRLQEKERSPEGGIASDGDGQFCVKPFTPENTRTWDEDDPCTNGEG
jgi:hypothetical protein